MMKKIAVFGGTGLVGKKVIKLLTTHSYELISYLRKNSTSSFGETQEIINFSQFDTCQFDGEVVVVCLGTTLKKAGSKEAFIKVDYELVHNIAIWAKNQEVSQFHVISSVGVSERAKGLYLQTKWRMEKSLIALDFDKLCIYRPSVYADLDRRPIRLKEIIAIPFAIILASLIKKFENYRPTHAQVLAEKIKYAIDADLPRITIFENTEILNS